MIQADEENRKLIFSEKEASWHKYSPQLTVGTIYEARVGSVEDYGAFVHLRFPDGIYLLTLSVFHAILLCLIYLSSCFICLQAYTT